MLEDLKRGNMLNRLFGIPADKLKKEDPERVGYLSKDKTCFILEATVEVSPEKAEKGESRTYKARITPKADLRYTKAPSSQEYRILVSYHSVLGLPAAVLEPFIDGPLSATEITGLDKETAEFLKTLPYFAKVYIIS